MLSLACAFPWIPLRVEKEEQTNKKAMSKTIVANTARGKSSSTQSIDNLTLTNLLEAELRSLLDVDIISNHATGVRIRDLPVTPDKLLLS